MGVLFSVLAAGLTVLKITLVIALPVWLFWKLTRCLWRDRGKNGAAPDADASC